MISQFSSNILTTSFNTNFDLHSAPKAEKMEDPKLFTNKNFPVLKLKFFSILDDYTRNRQSGFLKNTEKVKIEANINDYGYKDTDEFKNDGIKYIKILIIKYMDDEGKINGPVAFIKDLIDVSERNIDFEQKTFLFSKLSSILHNMIDEVMHYIIENEDVSSIDELHKFIHIPIERNENLTKQILFEKTMYFLGNHPFFCMATKFRQNLKNKVLELLEKKDIPLKVSSLNLIRYYFEMRLDIATKEKGRGVAEHLRPFVIAVNERAGWDSGNDFRSFAQKIVDEYNEIANKWSLLHFFSLKSYSYTIKPFYAYCPIIELNPL